jgi:hypothetical protein
MADTLMTIDLEWEGENMVAKWPKLVLEMCISNLVFAPKKDLTQFHIQHRGSRRKKRYSSSKNWFLTRNSFWQPRGLDRGRR